MTTISTNLAGKQVHLTKPDPGLLRPNDDESTTPRNPVAEIPDIFSEMP